MSAMLCPQVVVPGAFVALLRVVDLEGLSPTDDEGAARLADESRSELQRRDGLGGMPYFSAGAAVPRLVSRTPFLRPGVRRAAADESFACVCA